MILLGTAILVGLTFFALLALFSVGLFLWIDTVTHWGDESVQKIGHRAGFWITSVVLGILVLTLAAIIGMSIMGIV